MDFLIALFFSIAIVAVWAWLGDWSGGRHWERIRLRLATCTCPACGTAYGPAASSPRETLVNTSGSISYLLSCPRCGVDVEWDENGVRQPDEPHNQPLQRTGDASG